MSASRTAAGALSKQSLQHLPLSYASVSIGRNGRHSLPDKLSAISKAGFHAIELGFPDLVTFANQHLRPSKEITDSDYEDLRTAAKEVRSICESLNLKVLMLQPFSNFEGWPADSQERKDVFARAEGWASVMEACGCNMLQVGSTDSPAERIGRDRERFVHDLTELADFLAPKNIRIAYENWCWSTHAPDWEDVWSICKAVDRDNFGLCLDTFQSAGGEWADPTTQSGLLSDGRSTERIGQDWNASCQRLSELVDPQKIFILQISDAYKMQEPLAEEDLDGMRPRARWSLKFRPLPFEGYLPVADFARAVLKTGFRGWFSYEIFDEGPDGKGRQDADDLEQWAANARKCQDQLAAACVED